MANYQTPGVYVEEKSILPPSVAEVETAIPAFFGFTQTGPRNTPKRITSMVEYVAYFGVADPEKNISVTVEDDSVENVSLDDATKSKTVLYYAMQLYFGNGGGPCYIVSCGAYADINNDAKSAYASALKASSREDEPTLLVFPDAPFILSPEDYYVLMNNALIECGTLKDRFAIVDVVASSNDVSTSVALFREKISNNTEEAKYGAAYFPYLDTTLSYSYDKSSVNVMVAGTAEKAQAMIDARQSAASLRAQADEARGELDKAKKAAKDEGNVDAKNALPVAQDKFGKLDTEAKAAEQKTAEMEKDTAKQTFAQQNSLVRNQIEKKVEQLNIRLTPCAAVAGVYAATDSTRGVWKAPANVSLNYVSSTASRITDEEQGSLNIDVTAGKSINAIRTFIGMGTKIWGARTLAGNNNEWKYVNVRRFFNMVEESVKKSTYWAVFESNDINTWVKVRAMVENYLLLKWKDGALAGAKPDDAFYVRVGLGATMTPQDVLEGRMIVEIGLAAVRPAEFIILRFSHKLQVS